MLKELFVTILCFSSSFSCVSPTMPMGLSPALLASGGNVAYETTCKDDLETLGFYSEDYVTTNPSFITFTQRYFDDLDLRTYAYFCLPTLSINNDNYEIVDKMNITTLVGEDSITSLKKLRLISFDLRYCFFKFEVNGLENLSQEERSYDISSFTTIDENGDDVSVYSIGRVYHFKGSDNESLISGWTGVETITITQKEVSCYRFGNSKKFLWWDTGLFQSGNTYTDSWYIFFNTDRAIDTLLSATISFVPYEYYCVRSDGLRHVEDNITIDKITQSVDTQGSFWCNGPSIVLPDPEHPGQDIVSQGTTYTFYIRDNLAQRVVTIESGTTKISSFTNSNNVFEWLLGHGQYHTYETLDNILDLKATRNNVGQENFRFSEQANTYDWGVLFYSNPLYAETLVNAVGVVIENCDTLRGYTVSDVCILRLNYMTGGILYNLGAADVPEDDFTTIDVHAGGGLAWWQILLGVIGIVLLVILVFNLPKIVIAISQSVQSNHQNRKVVRAINKQGKKPYKKRKRK